MKFLAFYPLNYFSCLYTYSYSTNTSRLPRDPYMLALCSWKQEQVEGMGLVTFIVENILKEYDVDQNRVSVIKVSEIEFTMFKV